MKPSEILKQLNALREEYRRQSLSFTNEQKAEYDRLMKLRRERVKSFYADAKIVNTDGRNGAFNGASVVSE